VTLGASIFLIVVGLILAFAVDASIAGIDLQVIGLILAGAGLLGLVLQYTLWGPRRRTVTSSRTVQDPRLAAPAPEVVEERRVYDDDRPI